MKQVVLALVVGLVGASLALPLANAGPEPQDPQCFQVYPWSRLCEGDVRGFAEAILAPISIEPCSAALQMCVSPCTSVRGCVGIPFDCPTGPGCPPGPNDPRLGPVCATDKACVNPPQPDCIQVIPWSYLCSGNVKAFLEYFIDTRGLLS